MVGFMDLMGGGGLAALGAFLAVFVILAVAVYVYMALVLMTLAKKLGHENIAWLAWIPLAYLFLWPIFAKKNWAWGFIFLVPIVNVVFYIIWTWNIFEQRKYPGWLSLVPILAIIPVVGWLVGLAYMVIWGLVAWKDR